MKILVTGATGFVGANLVRALLEQGNIEVIITARKTSDFWRLKDVLPQINSIYYGDLADREFVLSMINETRPDVIYHLSTFGGFADQLDKEPIIKANLSATINLLDAAVEFNVGSFINTGSSSEYGVKAEPMKESDVCEPISLYGVTKLAATNYCAMIGKMLNYRVCTLRLFSPYGKYEAPSRLYASIVNALSQGQRPKLSKPDSVRDFIPVDKVVEVYIKLISCDFKPGEIFNVGSGRQQTIKEFYVGICQQMGVNLEPVWGEASQRFSEPTKWEADITKLKALMPEVFC
jgi:nucleoside-diphosphate-sugar epimerase